MSIIRKNVPNHSQSSVIAADLIRLRDDDCHGETLYWHGNSYGGYREYDPDGTPMYVLEHWSTVIAHIVNRDGALYVNYFNGCYISATTRGFQGRILAALDKMGVFGKENVRYILSKPTHKRGILMMTDAGYETI